MFRAPCQAKAVTVRSRARATMGGRHERPPSEISARPGRADAQRRLPIVTDAHASVRNTHAKTNIHALPVAGLSSAVSQRMNQTTAGRKKAADAKRQSLEPAIGTSYLRRRLPLHVHDCCLEAEAAVPASGTSKLGAIRSSPRAPNRMERASFDATSAYSPKLTTRTSEAALRVHF